MKMPELFEIKNIRKKIGLSQSELSKKSGVSQSLIARIESGRIDPGYGKVVAIFRALNGVHVKEVMVEEIMSAKVHSINASETMDNAAAKMKKHNVSQVPVIEKGRILGSISESTILNQLAAGANIRDLSRKKVSSCLDDPLPTVNTKTPVSTVSTLLENNPAVIVLEKDKVKGIVTKADLLKMMHK